MINIIFNLSLSIDSKLVHFKNESLHKRGHFEIDQFKNDHFANSSLRKRAHFEIDHLGNALVRKIALNQFFEIFPLR